MSHSHILLVDDLALHRRVAPIRLGSLGKDLVAVSSPDEADAYLARAEELPHLILLDVVMPGKDGFVYAAELKANPRTRDIPIMMLTALRANPFERSLEVGADDFLPKNVDDAIFRIRVRLHLHLRGLRLAQPGKVLASRGQGVLLASRSPLIRSQMPAQLGQMGHPVRVLERLEAVEENLNAEDRLLILDSNLDPEGLADFLTRLRMDPDHGRVPLLLLSEKTEMALLPSLETMVDDVLWKPLNAKVNRLRFQYLIELGQRAAV